MSKTRILQYSRLDSKTRKKPKRLDPKSNTGSQDQNRKPTKKAGPQDSRLGLETQGPRPRFDSTKKPQEKSQVRTQNQLGHLYLPTNNYSQHNDNQVDKLMDKFLEFLVNRLIN